MLQTKEVKVVSLETVNKDDVFIGVGAIGVIVILYILFKPKETEEHVTVTATIEDQNGNIISYDPTKIVKALRKGLTTTYYFDPSERWAAINKFYKLDNFRFMAVVKAYEAAYSVTLESDMRACTLTSPTFFKIYDRIETLETIIQ